MLIEPEYLDLILKAAQKRFARKGGELGEKRIQTAIVKQHMKKAPGDGRCVLDMEYMVKKEPSRFERFKPDIVAFDKNNGFRFIKLKYADNGSGKIRDRTPG